MSTEAKKKTFLPKTYIKQVDTQYGELLSMNIPDAANFCDFIKANKDAKGGIRFTITRAKEVSEFGNTHSAYVDTYVGKAKVEEEDMDDLPF